MRELEKRDYRLVYDNSTGEIAGLYDRKNPKANWKAENPEKKLGVVFLHGTQWGEDEIPFAKVVETEKGFTAVSATGATSVHYEPEEDRLHILMKTNKDCGPRMGLQMNLNLLDLPTENTWEYQCMPKVIYTDEECRYAYFVFATADGRFLGMTVNEEFAAWRIKYSYDGHRMTGFQILSQADDVKCEKGQSLPDVDRLAITLIFADDLTACLKKIAGQLGVAIALPEVSGGPVGGEIPVKLLNGQVQSAPPVVLAPDAAEKTQRLENAGGEHDGSGTLALVRPGIYRIRTAGKNGRIHSSRVLCHGSWKEMYGRITCFYREHFQDECGAFYRVIRKDSLKPEGLTFEGVAFGDPYAHFSCRTGEFGGFAGWAMMKDCQIFGKNPELMESIERYICNWALNYGHEEAPYIGTVYKKPANYMGRSYSAYHLFEELNYLQYEIFLLEELVDYVRLTDNREVLADAIALVEHVRTDHLENGAAVNENTPGHKVDYSTVHTAITGFLALAQLLKEQEDERYREKAAELYAAAEQIADHVCRRALDFPTEGEPCTEDGSMSCSVTTLLRAYMGIAPKKEYLEVAEQIMRAHTVLEMGGADCRMKNSTIRFWETQYESCAWGPSINAGHGWSIWNAEAKALYARIKSNFAMLKASYEGFVTNLCKVEENGGMSSCYTPDMIPGTPHAYYVTDVSVEAAANDERPTSTHLGGRYVPDSYAASGNYFLIRAVDSFAHMSGLDAAEGVAVNGVYTDGRFESAAPVFDYLLVKNVTEPLWVSVKKGQKITVAADGEPTGLAFENAEILECNGSEIVIKAETDSIIIHRK